MAFASEIKALKPFLSSVGVEPQISHQAVYDYMSLGSVPQPNTIYEEIQAVPAGTVVEYQSLTKRARRFWSPTFLPKSDYTFKEAKTRVREEVAEATRIRLRSDVPVGVFLSGGVDSSVVAYEVSNAIGARARSFTISAGSTDLDEGPVAKKTAARLGLAHTELRLEIAPLDEVIHIARHFDQPFGDSSAIPTLCVSRLARKFVTVVLNGDGGDEVFSGYRRYIAAYLAGHVVARPPARFLSFALGGVRRQNRRGVAGFAKRFGRGLDLGEGERWLVWTPDLLTESVKQHIWRGGDYVVPTEYRIEECLDEKLSTFDRHISADLKFILLSDLLVKMDMSSMAASLEARSPLLDHKVADFAFRLSPNLRLRRGRLKGLLRDSYQDVLPVEVFKSPKKGFEVPISDWLENDLSEVVNDTLGSPHPLVADFIDIRFVERILKDGCNFAGNLSQLIYSLLMLELWLREANEHRV
jgi:asparagine synthase (glutamine-hydrolysing)